ncbi:MAG: phage tail protein, partial [Candidatus Electrothrix sp. AR1]|nr:phage tail protein [Candidatus Electrothrix sp. AR1]
EGGQNLYTQKVPGKIQYDNLVLERGLVVGSPLSLEFNTAMTFFKFSASNVLVTLIDHTNIPISSWLFIKAFPVKWSVSDLDATQNSVVIQHLELSYQRFQTISL